MRILSAAILAAAAMGVSLSAGAQTPIGSVDTTTRFLGANDSIKVVRYDDPKVPNVSCYVSRAITGGIAKSFSLSTDKSLFSIACRGTGPVAIPAGLPINEPVFRASADPLFKVITVNRMLDRDKGVLVYLVASTSGWGGSPFNSVSAVPADAPPAR